MSNPIESLKAVLCDPEGKCCIYGSDRDRQIVDEALATLTAASGGVDEGMVERAARVVAKVAGEDFDQLGEFTQGVLMDTQRAALTAALKDGGGCDY